MKRVLLPLGVAALVLSGCSGSDGSEPVVSPSSSAPSSAAPSPSATQEAPATMKQGSFTFETADGGVGTLEVPGVPDAGIEDMRTVVGGDPVTYITGNMDNRAGASEFLAHTVTVYDADGQGYVFERAVDYVFDLLPGTEDPAYNEYVDFYDSVGSNKVSPLERADFVLVGPELPADPVGVIVSDGYTDFNASPQ